MIAVSSLLAYQIAFAASSVLAVSLGIVIFTRWWKERVRKPTVKENLIPVGGNISDAEVKAGIKLALDKMHRDGFKPDLIVSFDSDGEIIAGLLHAQLKDEVKFTEIAKIQPNKHGRDYVVEKIEYNPGMDNILIVCDQFVDFEDDQSGQHKKVQIIEAVAKSYDVRYSDADIPRILSLIQYKQPKHSPLLDGYTCYSGLGPRNKSASMPWHGLWTKKWSPNKSKDKKKNTQVPSVSSENKVTYLADVKPRKRKEEKRESKSHITIAS